MLIIDDDLWQAPLKTSRSHKKVKKNGNNYSSEKSDSGLSKDDKDYLMGVIKSMQQVIEIQSSIIKNNQSNDTIDEETIIEEKEPKIELSNEEIEKLTKEIIKGTKNIINNFVKNISK